MSLEYVGLDVGISTTDAVAGWAEDVAVSLPTEGAEASAREAVRLLLERTPPPRDVRLRIGATGTGAGRLPHRLETGEVVVIDEFEAIGRGGTRLARRAEGLVASLGTGTAFVAVTDAGIRQVVPGTGVGGGTIVGLARMFFPDASLEDVARLAARGDRGQLDFTIGDVVGGDLGGLPSDATASNLGRARAGARPEDVAAALANLVAEVVISTGFLALQATGAGVIIATGKLLLFEPVRRRLHEIAAKIPGVWSFPERGEVATALGALWSLREREETA